MTANRKKGTSAEDKPAPENPQPPDQGAPAAAAGEQQDANDKKRAAWVRKSPTEKMIEEIRKQEERVGKLKEELKKEEKALSKLLEAKKILETS